jgi:hypothetical protein
MEAVMLAETLFLGLLLLSIFFVMVLREKKITNRSWWLGVMVIAVFLYFIAISVTAIINTNLGF